MFENRAEAGRALAAQLKLRVDRRVVVLAVVRGGVPVGVEVAHAFDAPLDICLVKKIGAPFNQELAIGAVSLDAYALDVDYDTPDMRAYADREVARLQKLLHERALKYRQGRPPVKMAGACVVLVDDGVATGHTFQAALASVAQQKPKKIIVASPVISASAVALLEQYADEVVSVLKPENMYAIGEFYVDFQQLTDENVVAMLQEYWVAYDAVHVVSKKQN